MMAEGLEARADLHVHSTFSDGELAPAELVRRAADEGISIISIADHDTIEGVGEALREGDEAGVEVIPGTELSTIFHGLDIHVLGYFIDMENENLKRALAKFAEARSRRAEKMVGNLKRRGVGIEFEDVQKAAGRGTIGRPHIAVALMRRGVVRSFDEAFFNYIGMHCPAYVRKYELGPKEAVDLIHDAGGLAIIAHPLVGRQGKSDVLELLESGVDGMEATHPKMSPGDSDWVRRTARERGLLITGGSDYHGDNRGPGTLGENVVPAGCVQALKDALRDRERKVSRVI